MIINIIMWVVTLVLWCFCLGMVLYGYFKKNKETITLDIHVLCLISLILSSISNLVYCYRLI